MVSTASTSEAELLRSQRQPVHGCLAEGSRSLSMIEALPSEILQRIIFESGNGNLLLAAPRIAARLSGNESLYRVASTMAFYAHQYEEVLLLMRIKHWLAGKPDVKMWEIRSMTKAVLGSQWCTCGWVKTFLEGLKTPLFLDCNRIHMAGNDFTGHRDLEIDAVREFRERYKGVGTCSNFLRDPLRPLLPGDFYLHLEFDPGTYAEPEDVNPDGYPDAYDAFHVPWLKLTFRSIQWRFCGTALFRGIGCLRPHPLDIPFRDMVYRELMTRRYMKPQPFVQLRMSQMCRCCDGGITPVALIRGDWGSTSSALAVDYYFYPEDAHFKVDPLLFRCAALTDDPCLSGLHEYLLWQDFALLFEIDPTSLPRTDPVIIAYANRVGRRVRSTAMAIAKTRHQMRQVKEDGKITSQYRHLLCDELRTRRCLQKSDLRILAYITTGTTDLKTDEVFPVVRNPDICEVFEEYPESDYVASDDEGSLQTMRQKVITHLQDDEVLTLYERTLFNRNKQEVASVLKEHARLYLRMDDDVSEWPDPWPDPVLGMHDFFDNRPWNDIDWLRHLAFDGKYLQSLPDTTVPWDEYVLPRWMYPAEGMPPETVEVPHDSIYNYPAAEDWRLYSIHHQDR